MRRAKGSSLVAILCALALTACASTPSPAPSGASGDLSALLVTSAEADAWLVSPDDGPVDGETGDCTGAPYDWPDLAELGHASQFLDRTDESVAVVVRRFDGNAALNIEALRGALAPCSPVSGPTSLHGAMITLVGDDSFAYQTESTTDQGRVAHYDMLVSCGNFSMEVLSYSYSGQVNQPELESLVAPALNRMSAVGGC